jgi:hypothetical protein
VEPYVKLREALSFNGLSDEEVVRAKNMPVPEFCRKHGINHLVLYFDALIRARKPLLYFCNDTTEQWTIVEPVGRTLIVSWHDPEKKGDPPPLAGLRSRAAGSPCEAPAGCGGPQLVGTVLA